MENPFSAPPEPKPAPIPVEKPPSVPEKNERPTPPASETPPEIEPVFEQEAAPKREVASEILPEPKPQSVAPVPEPAATEIPEPKPEPIEEIAAPIPEPEPTPLPTPVVQNPDAKAPDSPDSTPGHHSPQTSFFTPTPAPDSEVWTETDFADDSDLPALSMEERSCRMCKYYEFGQASRHSARFGECRRNAPSGVGKAVWPSVLWDSWCGEWQMGVGQEEMMKMARTVAENVG